MKRLRYGVMGDDPWSVYVTVSWVTIHEASMLRCHGWRSMKRLRYGVMGDDPWSVYITVSWVTIHEASTLRCHGEQTSWSVHVTILWTSLTESIMICHDIIEFHTGVYNVPKRVYVINVMYYILLFISLYPYLPIYLLGLWLIPYFFSTR